MSAPNPPLLSATEVTDGGFVTESAVTLRDYFAAQIMPRMLREAKGFDSCAEDAYKAADALLKARQKPQETPR